ncbi:MAG: transcription-repair coupling factor [Thiohalomonadaceae bacterium]
MTDQYISPLQPRPALLSGERLRWGRLYGSSLALAIANVAQSHDALLLLVTADTATASRLKHELRFYLGDDESLPIMQFSSWETLPYDSFSPHQYIISERLATLHRLPTAKRGVLIASMPTLMHRLPPCSYLAGHSLMLKTGQQMDLEQMRQKLQKTGYRCVSQVVEHGEFAVRGALLDLFPMGSHVPYRIELFDDEIESLRSFDPDTQRSLSKVDEISLLPAHEFPLDEAGIKHFRSAWRLAIDGEPQRSHIYRDTSNALAPGGIEYYLPLFFEQTATLFDYLPDKTLVFSTEGSNGAADEFWAECKSRHEQLRHNIERPLLPPEQIFLRVEEVMGKLAAWPRTQLQNFALTTHAGNFNYASEVPPSLLLDARSEQPVAALQNFIDTFPGRILFAVESAGRREALLDLLGGARIKPQPVDSWQEFLGTDLKLALLVAPLEQGLLLQEPAIAVITEPQLYGQQVMQRRRRKSHTSWDAEAVIRHLTELQTGAPVVHEENGVGRYLGLQTLDIGEIVQEFLTLEYAGGDKLYVPVSSLHLISRYTGVSPDAAPLHKLGSGQWEKAKRKAREKVRDVAAELLAIYAQRAARKGYKYKTDPATYQAFAAGFPFEPTADQQTAIDAVLEDMAAARPMDRLICGDVGFGKTEVAMRAAFVAVMDGKQVAMLVPTTLLAQQHHESFRDRFADWPVHIESISRFKSRKEQEQIIADLQQGKIDIIIGTHKLLQESIKIDRLGLVIVDEEHRFGVRQKERFKALRAEVDVLTLTATPIPRTLNMSLAHIRDLSIIATAPAQRLAVKTFVSEWQQALIHEACLREIKRGGQVYFLHNDVATIEKMADEIAALLPEANVRHAHGQMPERELERVMSDFYHQRFNILVCTTIIETGIDIPTANTIIINRADRLGLAQLYQLRGRVGRSHHRAYAYLIVPQRRQMTADAVKRLEAIAAIEELGTGFTLATHDLEIRGAGELLGEDQSGQMQEIGFTLYSEMLERAVAALKSGKEPELDRPLDHGTEIDLHIPALIPDDYLPDVHSRLIMYKRIASAKSLEELRDLQVEMIDRFGLLPTQSKNLIHITELKLQASPLGIRKIELGPAGGRITFNPQPNIDGLKIIRLIQDQAKTYQLNGQERLRISKEMPDAESRFALLEELLKHLSD